MQSKNVVIHGVTKIYKGQSGKEVRAVDNVSLEIKAGEFVTLLGPSGCGKTTILRMIAGFETPTSGRIYIGSEDVTQVTADKRDTSMVFQSYALFPHLNVYDNVAYGLRVKKLTEKQVKDRVEDMLQRVGLAGLQGRFPNQLSGGQQQRVALARALVMEPSVLLFDEPLSNLDAKLRVHMRSEIRKLQQNFSITAVYVTHDQAEAMSMSDRIIVINNGAIEQSGSPREIYCKPRTEFVADFIGMANILDAEVSEVTDSYTEILLLGERLRVSTKTTTCKGEPIKVVIRPDAIQLTDSGGISATIDTSVYMGHSQDYRLLAGSTVITVIDYNVLAGNVFAAGTKVAMHIDPAAIHIIKR